MKLPLVPAALAVALAAFMTSGCSPQPDPEPAPAFASEAEAFEAAEATYRAYVDALNAVDLSDPETFEDVYAWTTGDANANERKSLTQMHADGWTVSGETVTQQFIPKHADLDDPVLVTAIACSDVGAIGVVDSEGNSKVSADRSDVYALSLEFEASPTTTTGLALAKSNGVEDPACTG